MSLLLKCEIFKELTHLNLTIVLENTTIDANNVFKNIEMDLPKLQSLIITLIFNCNEYTADILSRLSYLKAIYLNITKESPKDIIENKLKEKSKRITNIELFQYI